MIKVKSIRDHPAPDDGARYLVERFWPQGIHTHTARLDEWLRDLGPSYNLQRFASGTSDWKTYREKYQSELLNQKSCKQRLKELAVQNRDLTITLLHDGPRGEKNHAWVVKELVEKQLI